MKIKVITIIWVLSLLLIPDSYAATNKGKNEPIKSCTYSARSISKPTLAGINLSRGINFSIISQVGGILAGNTSSVPLDFFINLDVINPNQKAVTIQEVDYILRVDNVELTRGTYKKKLKIGGNKKKNLPLGINVDLATLLKSNSGTALNNMVKNFMRNGTKPTNISLQIRPTYKIGKEVLPAPRYLPLNFSFGGNF